MDGKLDEGVYNAGLVDWDVTGDGSSVFLVTEAVRTGLGRTFGEALDSGILSDRNLFSTGDSISIDEPLPERNLLPVRIVTPCVCQ